MLVEFFNLQLTLAQLLSFQYIDPGSGSAIMSAIIGFFVVIGITIKSFWYKIKSFFIRSNREDSE